MRWPRNLLDAPRPTPTLTTLPPELPVVPTSSAALQDCLAAPLRDPGAHSTAGTTARRPTSTLRPEPRLCTPIPPPDFRPTCGTTCAPSPSPWTTRDTLWRRPILFFLYLLAFLALLYITHPTPASSCHLAVENTSSNAPESRRLHPDKPPPFSPQVPPHEPGTTLRELPSSSYCVSGVQNFKTHPIVPPIIPRNDCASAFQSLHLPCLIRSQPEYWKRTKSTLIRRDQIHHLEPGEPARGIHAALTSRTRPDLFHASSTL